MRLNGFDVFSPACYEDVECTFGILKGRFRILKTGIPLHGIEVCDRVWFTCCALHNFLLEEDGLDGEWGATRYHLDVEESSHDKDDVRAFFGTKFWSTSEKAIAAIATHDSSGMGPGSDKHDKGGEDDESDEDDDDDSGSGVQQPIVDTDGCIRVHSLTLESFRNRLINHFDILWRRNQILWPTQTGTEPPSRINEPNERYTAMFN